MLSLPPYVGDIRVGLACRYFFNTVHPTTGVPTTLVNGGPLKLSYQDVVTATFAATTFTLDADFGGVIGLNMVYIDTSDGEDAEIFPLDPPLGFSYAIRLAAGATVGGVSVANRVVCNFTINQRGPKQDTSGRVTVAPAGLDAVQVEAGVNARQALALNSAASGGAVSGAATGVVSIAAAGDDNTERISASVDSYGNRRSITLTLPA